MISRFTLKLPARMPEETGSGESINSELIASSANAAAAVVSVSRRPHRYAAASRGKVKKTKNGLSGPSVHSMTAAATLTTVRWWATANERGATLLNHEPLRRNAAANAT